MNYYLNFMNKITAITKLALIFIVSLMIILVFIQVPGRYIFNSTPAYLSEIATYCLIWTAFIGSSLAIEKNKHVSLTLFVDKLSGKSAMFITVVSNLSTLVFLLILLIATSTFAISSWEQTSPTLKFRITWAVLGAPIGTLLMILQVIKKMFETRRD